jgi:hypothetical protein
VQVVYNFGREEPATREALERLVASVARHLEPGKAKAIAAEALEFTESPPLGGTHVLDALWQRLGHRPGDAGAAEGPAAGCLSRAGAVSTRSWPQPAP